MNKYSAFITDTFSHWQEKRASRMGAAISYYAIFSIAPLFILLMAVVRVVFDKRTTETVVAHILNVTIGTNLSTIIQTLINGSYRVDTDMVTAVIGVGVLIIAALSVLAELNNDLDELWNTTSKKVQKESTFKTILEYIKDRFIALSLILLFGIAFMFIVALSVFISFFHYSLPVFFQNTVIITTINALITLIGSTALFSVIYRVLPDTKLPWRELLWGALATAVLFLIGKFLISWYIVEFGDTIEYGAASSIVGFLLWVYYSAQVFFIGASATFVYSKQYGFLSRK